VTAFHGNGQWTGYDMISGGWYTGPGQAVVPTNFLTVTGTAVGDTVTVEFAGSPDPRADHRRGLRHQQSRARHAHRLADAGRG